MTSPTRILALALALLTPFLTAPGEERVFVGTLDLERIQEEVAGLKVQVEQIEATLAETGSIPWNNETCCQANIAEMRKVERNLAELVSQFHARYAKSKDFAKEKKLRFPVKDFDPGKGGEITDLMGAQVDTLGKEINALAIATEPLSARKALKDISKTIKAIEKNEAKLTDCCSVVMMQVSKSQQSPE